MKIRMGVSFILITALLLGTLASCRRDASNNVVIIATDNGWDSQRFHNALARLVIENAFEGYELRFSTASSTMNWESMRNGDVDIDIESWTENVATFEEDVRVGDIVVVGVLVPDSRQGLYVPRFVIYGDPARGIAPMAPTLRRVEDLLRYPHVFPDEESPGRGRIFGSIPGWMADVILHKKFLYHGLDRSFNYVRLGSEAALFASLMSAYNLGQAWVGYCYEPTWIAGRLDLVLLEAAPYEPAAFLEGRTAFPDQQLKTVSSRYFPERAPEPFEFLRRFRTSGELVSEALAFMYDTRANHDQAAIWFLRNNNELIDEWLPSANAAKLREHLSQR